MSQQQKEYKATYYESFSRRYEKIPVIKLELVPKHFLSMGEYAQKYSITPQRAHQLYRMGLVRGVKASENEYETKIRVFLDPESAPPKLKSWSRKRAATKLGLESP